MSFYYDANVSDFLKNNVNIYLEIKNLEILYNIYGIQIGRCSNANDDGKMIKNDSEFGLLFTNTSLSTYHYTHTHNDNTYT